MGLWGAATLGRTVESREADPAVRGRSNSDVRYASATHCVLPWMRLCKLSVTTARPPGLRIWRSPLVPLFPAHWVATVLYDRGYSLLLSPSPSSDPIPSAVRHPGFLTPSAMSARRDLRPCCRRTSPAPPASVTYGAPDRMVEGPDDYLGLGANDAGAANIRRSTAIPRQQTPSVPRLSSSPSVGRPGPPFCRPIRSYRGRLAVDPLERFSLNVPGPRRGEPAHDRRRCRFGSEQTHRLASGASGISSLASGSGAGFSVTPRSADDTHSYLWNWTA